MDEAEQDQYEARLKELFDSFDSTGTGSLGQEELTDLCHVLHLEEVAPALQQTLLQGNLLGRVRSWGMEGADAWGGFGERLMCGICVHPALLRLWCCRTAGVCSALLSRVGTRAGLVMAGEGTALSALTGGGLKVRKPHFGLSLVPWCFPRARAGARSGCPWLTLCPCPQRWFLGHLPKPAQQVLRQALSHLGWDKALNPGPEPVIYSGLSCS